MRRWATLVALLALGACGSSPQTQFYTLLPDPPGGSVAAAASGPPLVVDHVALPGTLDRAALVTQGPGPAVTVSDNERWAAPLDELTQRTLTADLRARLGATAVLAPGDPIPPRARRVVLTMQRFGVASDGNVVLEADWSFANGNARESGPIHHARIVEKAGSAQGAAVVEAMSRALGSLADKLCTAAGEAG